MRTWIEALGTEVGNQVTIKGWVHRIKLLKSVAFVIVKDKSGLVQCVCDLNAPELDGLTHESVVAIEGTVAAGKNDYNAFEIHVSTMTLLNAPARPLPIQVNGKTMDVQLDTLLNNRVLALRHPQERAIFRIQSTIANAFRSFLQNNAFTEIFTPKLVKEGAEGGSNLFEIEYFEKKAYLTQSPQFYKQMMVISGMERVFEVAPVFRAEQHSTRRHLNQYVSLDLEMAFIEDFHELMTLETALLKSILLEVETKHAEDLELLGVTCPKIPNVIPEMKLCEAIELLKTEYGKVELDGDLDPEGERLIGEHIFKTTGSEFVFLTHYPREKRPMYTMPSGETETEGFDLLFRGLEITTGGLRIHNYDALIDGFKYKGLLPENYESYLEAFKYGAPPHGGLAIGLERLTAQLLGYENVRRTTLFPRDAQRLTP